MTRRKLTDTFVFWLTIEIAAMTLCAFVVGAVGDCVGSQKVYASLAPATVLLSVAVAIVIQLWVKLNDLSGLAALSAEERTRLWGMVKFRVRSLMWLVVFFVAFIFAMLLAGALGSFESTARPLTYGLGAGLGAFVVLIAGVLVDLNEVAHFRWTVETSDHVQRSGKASIEDLRKSESGFEDDENLKSYRQVIKN